MKKLLVLLAMVLAFTLTSVAQYGSSSTSSSSGQTSDQTTSGKKSKKSAASSDQAGASETGKAGKAKKESTLTGCLSAQPDASGNFMLTNGKHKKGVKVEPADKVKDHAGHQVHLTGQWSGSGAEKSFEVASLKHISETCKEAKGGGTTGETKKGEKDKKKGKDTDSTAPKS